MNYRQSSVNLQPPPSGNKSSTAQASLKEARPSRPPPPSKPPPRSMKSQLSQPVGVHFSKEAEASAETVAKSTSHPQLSVSLPDTETDSQDQRVNNTPSPATGQLHPEQLDGVYTCTVVYACGIEPIIYEC